MSVVKLSFYFCRGERVLASVPLMLDADTMTLEPPPAEEPLPDWAQIGFKQCSNCPVAAGDQPYCPFAASLVRPLEQLRPLMGEGTVTLRVVSDFGVTSEDMTVAGAISRLMSVISAASGCPQMTFMRPLARLPLPLAPGAGTTSRAAGLYTLTQIFLRKGGATDEALSGLSQVYKDVQMVNTAMAKRLRAALTAVDGPIEAERLVKLFAEILPRTADDQLTACRHRLGRERTPA